MKILKNKKKAEEILFPEVLKVLIAVVCIGFLIYFSVLLFMMFLPGTTAIQQARANLDKIIAEVNTIESEGSPEQITFTLTPAKQYHYLFLSTKQNCGGVFCLCLAIKGQTETPVCKPVNNYVYTTMVIYTDQVTSNKFSTWADTHKKYYHIDALLLDSSLSLKLENIELHEEFFVLRVLPLEIEFDEVRDATKPLWSGSDLKTVPVLHNQLFIKLDEQSKTIQITREGLTNERPHYILGKGLGTGEMSWGGIPKPPWVGRDEYAAERKILEEIENVEKDANWKTNVERILYLNGAKKISSIVKLSVMD